MSQIDSEDALRQRADFTHKYNLGHGRHGWLRLTPAYSVRVVEDILAQATTHQRVLDPFCGTATTALSAANHGHDAVTADINPFLVWLGRAKTAHYAPADLARARDAAARIAHSARSASCSAAPLPPLHNIERWWPPAALDYLQRLRQAIDDTADAASAQGALLRVAFCRTLIASSNAAFNHQSMSFKDDAQAALDMGIDYAALFECDVNEVLQGAATNPVGQARIHLHDARALSTMAEGPFDLVITSPPYANRMSYIRELRPYMYWLGFLTNGRDAAELDWQAIGGTWGVATSRLKTWQPASGAYASDEMETVLARVADPANANGDLLARYIRKYCVDMATHFQELRAVLAPGARLHYIVGNSTFYGELVSIERIYVAILEALGFESVQAVAIRKRNSKRDLVEFDVRASWPG